MQIEIQQKRKINELEKEVEYWKGEATSCKERAEGVYGEYELLCYKIKNQGMFFKPQDTEGDTPVESTDVEKPTSIEYEIVEDFTDAT